VVDVWTRGIPPERPPGKTLKNHFNNLHPKTVFFKQKMLSGRFFFAFFFSRPFFLLFFTVSCIFAFA
jgi:hypothetical protein